MHIYLHNLDNFFYEDANGNPKPYIVQIHYGQFGQGNTFVTKHFTSEDDREAIMDKGTNM
jgi:hypothetical protein